MKSSKKNRTKALRENPFDETTTAKVVIELTKLQGFFAERGDIATAEALAYLVIESKNMNKKDHDGNYSYRGN